MFTSSTERLRGTLDERAPAVMKMLAVLNVARGAHILSAMHRRLGRISMVDFRNRTVEKTSFVGIGIVLYGGGGNP
jgi:hypothetical protein